MKITYAEEKDIAAIATAEAACFPPTEAATEQEFVERIKYYGNHFWLLYDAAKLPSSRLQTAAKATANGSDRFSRSNGCTLQCSRFAVFAKIRCLDIFYF